MAFDGVVIANVVYELNNRAIGGRIYKIQQPETDEICLVIKNNKDTFRLLISADASLPLMYITEDAKENPLTAPAFCMLLRKHLGNGRIIGITQPGFERIVEISIEHLDEMGDLCRKKLVVEIMGKHSNIIFVDDDGTIIDSIKHVSHQISSVREVLPGRNYEYPPNKDKYNPMTVSREELISILQTKPEKLSKAIYTSINGLSPVMAEEICNRAGLDGGMNCQAMTEDDTVKFIDSFNAFFEDIKNGEFYPCIAFLANEPKEYAATRLSVYEDAEVKAYESISKVLSEYYSRKSIITRIKQKSVDLRKIVSASVARTAKKYDLQSAQMKDTDNREKYRIYGELINVYGYGLEERAESLSCENYYDDNKEITIPLDKRLTAQENSKRYFAIYNKKKRTYEALLELLEETKAELEYLLSVQNSLDMAETEADLAMIKEELIQSGFVKGRISGNAKGKGKQSKSQPFHYISSDGYHIYVGKNNIQNEELSFKVAEGNDLWFHAKKIPGSHVIVKTNGQKIDEIPDRTFEEAARLAAYYSQARTNPKVEIDYVEKKQLKKPPKANPGFVIYHTNYSMIVEPDITGIEAVDGKR